MICQRPSDRSERVPRGVGNGKEKSNDGPRLLIDEQIQASEKLLACQPRSHKQGRLAAPPLAGGQRYPGFNMRYDAASNDAVSLVRSTTDLCGIAMMFHQE